MKQTPPLTGAHPIRVVSRRTGLSPDVLRVWEKRYGAVTPGRTSTGRRTYSDADLERLQLLRQATLTGRRIGDVAGLPTETLRQLVERDAGDLGQAPASPAGADSPVAPKAWLEDALAAVRALDAPRFESTLRRALLALGLSGLIDTLIVPLVQRIGRMWEDGSLDPYEEHFATVGVRRVLEEAIRDGSEDPSRPVVVVATPSGQRHEIGALLAAATAAARGWQTVYLGPDLPAQDIARAAQTRRARAVALSLVYPRTDPQLDQELRTLRDRLPRSVAVLVGGSGVSSYRGTLAAIGATVAEDLRDLGDTLATLPAGGGPDPSEAD